MMDHVEACIDVKKNGRSFYEDALGNPKFIVAPMVDQSELAWRMMARKYGAQLCYTPMINANVIIHNSTYRKKVLEDLSCETDRPLIVQFCSNSTEQFINACLIVQEHCDAIDLNLGCPQHIAKRGHFGAFLQDEWKLLSEMITQSSRKLSVPITAKIRVFSEIKKTIDYAKMLESSGCSLITIHGRTREKKGSLSGLADWNYITEVKKNVNIPVISNGNIQCLNDIERCLKETNADGVMVAESHLTNPALFQGENPSVYEIVKEYISYVNIYPCPISFVRSHLFKLWVHALKIHPQYQEILGRAHTMDEMMRINEELRVKCEHDMTYQDKETIVKLPHWICQPHVRGSGIVKANKPFNSEMKHGEEAKHALSRNQRRRLAKHHRKLEAVERKRQLERERRKEKRDEEKKSDTDSSSSTKPRISITKKTTKALIETRLSTALRDSGEHLKICVDLSWRCAMNSKEISKLANQLGRVYGSNRRFLPPAALYFTGLSKDSELYRECIRKHNGFENYKIEMTEKSHLDMFCKESLVYLSSDAETELDDPNLSQIYVLGGLVDESVSKQLSRKEAQKNSIETRRLPIERYMSRSGHHNNYSTVLAVNQVFDILMTFNCKRSWPDALLAGMPQRKGYILKNAGSL